MTQRNRLSFVNEKSDSIINSTQLRTRTHQIIRLTHLAIRVDNCQLSSWKLLGLNEFEVQTLASLNLRHSFWLVDSSKKVRDLRGSAAKINPTLSTILLSVVPIEVAFTNSIVWTWICVTGILSSSDNNGSWRWIKARPPAMVHGLTNRSSPSSKKLGNHVL